MYQPNYYSFNIVIIVVIIKQDINGRDPSCTFWDQSLDGKAISKMTVDRFVDCDSKNFKTTSISLYVMFSITN